MKALVTLIAILATSISHANVIQIQTQKPFVLVDPLTYGQPALKLYLAKDDPESKASISLHKEILKEGFDLYIKKTKAFIESEFNVSYELLGDKKSGDGKNFYMISFDFNKTAEPLKMLHAFYQDGDTLYVLAYSASKKHFGKYLDHFQEVLRSFKLQPLPPSLELAKKEMKDLIQSKRIPIKDFMKQKEIVKILENALFTSVTSEELFAEHLLTLREQVYEK